MTEEQQMRNNAMDIASRVANDYDFNSDEFIVFANEIYQFIFNGKTPEIDD